MMIKNFVLRGFVVGLTALAAWSVHAQAYPDRPVRILVPFAAGTATDVMARSVANALNKTTGQTFFIENRPGALGTLGTAEAARAKPDGYTLLLGGSTSMSAGPLMLIQKPTYNAESDFIPIGRVAASEFLVVVRPQLGVNSLQELIDLARKRGNAKPLAWGYANSANLAAATVLINQEKLETTKVPYKGVPQMMQDLLGGVIDFAVPDMANTMPLIRAGKLRALANTTSGETPDLPGVPPLGKFVKGFELLVWSGLFAPKGTPEPIIEMLAQNLRKGLAISDVRTSLESTGMKVFYGTRDEMKSYLTEDILRWQSLVKTANIQPE